MSAPTTPGPVAATDPMTALHRIHELMNPFWDEELPWQIHEARRLARAVVKAHEAELDAMAERDEQTRKGAVA